MVTQFKVKLIHRLKTQVGREVEKKCLSRETSVNSPTTSHSPSSGMSAPSAPHNPTSWYRRTSLDNATNYQIGKAKQNAKEVWAHRKPLQGNLINCYLARTVPVPRNNEIEHCLHLLSYLFVHVFSCFVFLFLQQCMASILAVHLRDETVTRISFHFTVRRGKGGGGMSRYRCLTVYVFRHVFGGSRKIVCFLWLFAIKTRNTESGLYTSFRDLAQHSSLKTNWNRPGFKLITVSYLLEDTLIVLCNLQL